MTDTTPKQPDYIGHRERMVTKLLEKGAGIFTESELLELILMRAIPRKDVKPIARELLRRFGSFAKVITAKPEELYTVKYVKESTVSLFMLIQGACEMMLLPRKSDKVVIDNFEKLVDYLRVKLAPKTIEYVYTIYLNRGCQVIVSEELRAGYDAQVPIYPKEILQRALNLNAHYVILVHNHPSGDAQPSRADVELTTLIEKLLTSADIKLYDHLIISSEKVYSIRNKRFLS